MPDLFSDLDRLLAGDVDRITPMTDHLFNLAAAKLVWHSDAPNLREAVRGILVKGSSVKEVAAKYDIGEKVIYKKVADVRGALEKVADENGLVIQTFVLSRETAALVAEVQRLQTENIQLAGEIKKPRSKKKKVANKKPKTK